jgi:hypothetical protein
MVMVGIFQLVIVVVKYGVFPAGQLDDGAAEGWDVAGVERKV